MEVYVAKAKLSVFGDDKFLIHLIYILLSAKTLTIYCMALCRAESYSSDGRLLLLVRSRQGG